MGRMFQQLIEAGLLFGGQNLSKLLLGPLQFGMQSRGDGLHNSARLVLAFLEDFVDFLSLFLCQIEVPFHATKEIKSNPARSWPGAKRLAHQ